LLNHHQQAAFHFAHAGSRLRPPGLALRLPRHPETVQDGLEAIQALAIVAFRTAGPAVHVFEEASDTVERTALLAGFHHESRRLLRAYWLRMSIIRQCPQSACFRSISRASGRVRPNSMANSMRAARKDGR
jgi:hypothetical protein